jgi:hypothetical protein
MYRRSVPERPSVCEPPTLADEAARPPVAVCGWEPPLDAVLGRPVVCLPLLAGPEAWPRLVVPAARLPADPSPPVTVLPVVEPPPVDPPPPEGPLSSAEPRIT